jgi:hypothetical protein
MRKRRDAISLDKYVGLCSGRLAGCVLRMRNDDIGVNEQVT